MSVILMYATFPTQEEARSVSEALVQDRLVACANIMAPHMAVYHWGGKLEQGAEVAVIFKTRADLFEKAKNRILELHSHDCPCVVAWPIEKGHPAFLQWIQDETEK